MKVEFKGTLEAMNLAFDFNRKGSLGDFSGSGNIYPEAAIVDGCVLKLKVIEGIMNINNVNDLDALQSKKVLITIEVIE